jgi:hypothetical protein
MNPETQPAISRVTSASIERVAFTRRAIFAAAFLISIASAPAAVLNVMDYGATGNDSTDDFNAITATINASVDGDTIYFPAGTYDVSTALTLISNRTYFGQPGAILNMTGTSQLVAGATSPDTNITLLGLTFQTGGLWFNTKVAPSNILIRKCTFQNIAAGNGAIYFTAGTNVKIIGNKFLNVTATCIAPYTVSSLVMTDNYFQGCYECIHVNDACPNMVLSRNVAVSTHRAGVEVQGSGDQNLMVEDNHFSNWSDPYYDSWGLSIVQQSGPNVIAQYNTIIGHPAPQPPPHSNYPGGFELGYDMLVQNNFVEGFWGTSIIVGGARTTVKNNVLRGPVAANVKVGTEPGYDPNTDVFTNNSQTVTSTYVTNPSALTATSSNATQAVLHWVNNDSSQTGIQVQRHNPGGTYTTIATLSGTATSYTDSTVSSNQTYVYRLYAYNGTDFTYSPTVVVSARRFEAESLTVPNYFSKAGGTVRIVSDSNFSNGSGRILDSNYIGDYVTFLLSSVAAGSYDVKVGMKNFYSRGQFQLQCGLASNFSGSATNVGPVIDEYAANPNVYEYVELDLGVWSPGSTSDKWFRFNVAGKNPASSGTSYNDSLSIDYIELTPQ